MAPPDQRDERGDEYDAFDDDVDEASYTPWDGEPGGWSGEVYDDSYSDAPQAVYSDAADRDTAYSPARSAATRGGHPAGYWDRLRQHGQRLVNTIAFVIPLVLLAAWLGVGGLLTRDSGESPSAGSPADASPTVAAAGAWPPGVVFVRQTVPAMIKDVIDVPDGRRGYQFEGTRGQVWTLTAEPLFGSSLDPALSLYAPSGALLLQNDDRGVGDVTAAIVAQLDENGSYRVIVEASGGASTGDFLLSLFAQ